MPDIPVAVIIVTRNEEPHLAKCMAALTPFHEIIVVDSNSTDNTRAVAKSMGADVVAFEWNGQYPKKRQWCLQQLALKHDYVFMVDADEIVTPELIHDISMLFEGGAPPCVGYFVAGQYVRGGDVLCYGLKNNKLALFDRTKMEYPVVDDLDIEGMGEIEGHYQPVFKAGIDGTLGQLSHPLLHDAYGDDQGTSWLARHRRYAHWEAMMDVRAAWPQDPVSSRQNLKRVFKRIPCRGAIAFIHSYILRFGFLDGVQGFLFARDRARYYNMIAAEKKKIKRDGI